MPSVALSQSDFDRVFGPKDNLDSNGPGRSRKCKVCGGWHRLDMPWPHNCRSEAPPRNPDLAMPQVAPAFQPFKASVHPDAPVIGSRNDKRDYMDRNGLAEYEPGVRNEGAQWAREKEERRELEADIQRFDQTDMDYWTPEQRGDVAPTEALETDGKDVDLTTAEGLSGGQ